MATWFKFWHDQLVVSITSLSKIIDVVLSLIIVILYDGSLFDSFIICSPKNQCHHIKGIADLEI